MSSSLPPSSVSPASCRPQSWPAWSVYPVWRCPSWICCHPSTPQCRRGRWSPQSGKNIQSSLLQMLKDCNLPRKYSLLFVFLYSWLVCVVQSCLLSSHSPRYLYDCTASTSAPSSRTGRGLGLDLPKSMTILSCRQLVWHQRAKSPTRLQYSSSLSPRYIQRWLCQWRTSVCDTVPRCNKSPRCTGWREEGPALCPRGLQCCWPQYQHGVLQPGVL